MKHVVRKMYWNYEKEEQWINEMCAKGLHLDNYSWARYTFAEGMPGEYTYRIELLENSAKHVESIAYIEFLEENNVEHVSSYLRWVYLRKKTSEGEFEIYTDNQSKLKSYQSVNRFWMMLLVMNMSACAANLSLAFSRPLDNSWGLININSINVVITVFLAAFILIISRPLRKKIRQLKKDVEVHQ